MADTTPTSSPTQKHSKRKPVRAEPRPPSEVRDDNDPGDATQRNFRYQHAYGVILLIGGRRKLKPYVALWCEHHDDFLAQRSDGKFDAYQVKTSKSENGAWRLTDEEVVRSVGRFLDLVAEFGEHIDKFFFVSNTDFDIVADDHKDQRRRGRCPVLLVRHLQSIALVTEIAAPFAEAFAQLRGSCGCTDDQLLGVLRRLDFIIGPSRSDFEASLSHDHVGACDECRGYTPQQLDEVRDGLIGTIFRASSLQVSDPIRHLTPLINGVGAEDPTIRAKRISIEAFSLSVNGRVTAPTFVFPGDPKISLGTPRPATALKQKLDAGGLEDDVEFFSDRERAAEFNLMEDVTLRPDLYPQLLKQIEEKVRGECQEAHLRTRSESAPFGRSMMVEVQERLKRLAVEGAPSIGNHSYDCLLGVAALLTSECSVWWSKRFAIQREQSQ